MLTNSIALIFSGILIVVALGVGLGVLIGVVLLLVALVCLKRYVHIRTKLTDVDFFLLRS